MQQSPIFQTTCKDGKLRVDQMNISVVALFHRLVWSIPRDSVTNIIQRPGVLSTGVEIYSTHGVYIVETLSKSKASEFAALFVHPAPPQVQPQQSPTKPSPVPEQTVPRDIPIDAEIQRIKLEIEQRRLQLSQVNADMATIRSHYQQSHLHGGGKVVGFVRTWQQSDKDAQLRKLQPVKEQLQREKLALEQQLNQLKIRKAQGTTHITPPRQTK